MLKNEKKKKKGEKEKKKKKQKQNWKSGPSRSDISKMHTLPFQAKA